MRHHQLVATIVVDTDVLVAAIRGPGGASREVIRRCLGRAPLPLMGTMLLTELEDVLGRESLFEGSILTGTERQQLLDAYLSVCRWVRTTSGGGPIFRTKAITI